MPSSSSRRASKAFSAGGDVRELVRWGREDRARAQRAFAEEYALNWLHECFSKPTISLIDGPVMGSGVGITLYGTHRVAGEGYRFAMPETAIGLFPDVGTAWTLSRLPDAIGMYLGLTGRSIGRADAYALGLLTHCIPAARFEEIKAALIDTWPVDPLLDERHVDPGPGELAPYAEHIARCFSAPTVEEIVDAAAARSTGQRATGRRASSPISRRARRCRSRSRTGTSAMHARSTCARRCRSTTGSPAASSMDTISTRACARRSSTRTARRAGSPRGSRTSRRRWSRTISRRWALTSWRCRRARRCRPRACEYAQFV